MRVLALSLLLCRAAWAADLPDHKLTPGLADSNLTKAKLCAAGFSTKSIRNVDNATRHRVYLAYRMAPKKLPCPCEVDHLVPLELGGANDEKNLWPQSYGTKPYNAHVKDELENQLHELVCRNLMNLKAAQDCIRADWIKCQESVKH